MNIKNMNHIKHIALFSSCLLLASCGSSDSDNNSEADSACVVTEIESDLDQQLAGVSTDTDFSFTVKREDGREYIFNRGDSTLQTFYQSASTSKMVASVIILRLVEQGYLSLTDSP